MSNKKILKFIKFQGKSSSTRGIKTKKLPELDRVKTVSNELENYVFEESTKKEIFDIYTDTKVPYNRK